MIANKLATLRAEIEADPARYGTVTCWQDAERIHALLHARDRSRSRRVPMQELRQKLVDSGAYAALRNARENIGTWTVAQRQAVTAIADAIQTVPDVDAGTFIGWLDDLLAVGLLGQARRDALAAVATEVISRAGELGLPADDQCSAADIWEAFGWPGRLEPGKRPANRDPKTGEMVP